MSGGGVFEVVRVSARTGRVTVMEPQVDGWLTGPECAQRLGIAASTWRVLVRSGSAPPPDDPDSQDGARPLNRRSPRWRESTLTAYMARRRKPGRPRKKVMRRE